MVGYNPVQFKQTIVVSESSRSIPRLFIFTCPYDVCFYQVIPVKAFIVCNLLFIQVTYVFRLRQQFTRFGIVSLLGKILVRSMTVVNGSRLLGFLYGIAAINTSSDLILSTEENDLTLVDCYLDLLRSVFNPGALLCRNKTRLYLEDHHFLMQIFRSPVGTDAVGIIHQTLFFMKNTASHHRRRTAVAFFIKNISFSLFILLPNRIADDVPLLLGKDVRHVGSAHDSFVSNVNHLV